MKQVEIGLRAGNLAHLRFLRIQKSTAQARKTATNAPTIGIHSPGTVVSEKITLTSPPEGPT